MKYLLATLAVLLIVGLVWLHVHHEHAVVAPPVVAEPAPAEPSGFSGPPVVPVEPEPAPAAPAPPAVHKPVHKHMYKHYKVIVHGFYFHDQWCAHKWVVLPGSVTCLESGQQFLPDELEWSIPK